MKVCDVLRGEGNGLLLASSLLVYGGDLHLIFGSWLQAAHHKVRPWCGRCLCKDPGREAFVSPRSGVEHHPFGHLQLERLLQTSVPSGNARDRRTSSRDVENRAVRHGFRDH